MITYMQSASEYNVFNETYVKHIHNRLPHLSHVCDVGCGLGYLSLELAKVYKQVTAVDIAPAPLCVLRENIQKSTIKNIEVIEGDVFTMRPQHPYDAMVFSFFGSLSEILNIGVTQCQGSLVILKRQWQTHRFSLNEEVRGSYLQQTTPQQHSTTQKNPRHASETKGIEAQLMAMNIPFQSEILTVELGQPFHDLNDAIAFYKLYERTPVEEQDYAAIVKSRLIQTQSEVFPLYLPMERQVGMIVIQTKDLPQNRGKK